jgi:DNA modification methylase
MCQHIIRVSSRKGALVLDPFCGSGNMLRAAFVEGRRYLGGDSDAHWARKAGDWIPQPFDVPLFEAAP